MALLSVLIDRLMPKIH